ncbi:TetR/AcrR family transcriptional regulator [Streptomyces avicenniae]|uniref:TetR/AcrR family transcriptional regulator n=1 Tax=Streptomyces avicenniae TaxID=500153 RepID=UPI00069B01C1|nr:TetR/AcrR family transcriptional regulator [Streptomyces avicenniae]
MAQARDEETGQERRVRGRRSDARRNAELIIDAAWDVLGRDPGASMGDIAQGAGVGRVTLYSHFGSRPELVEAVLAHAMTDAEASLRTVDLGGDPRAALTRLIDSSWRIVDRSRALLRAAQDELSPERIRALHEAPMRRIHTLIERGQSDGIFRADAPTAWLVATFYSVLHTAADEITADRLTEEAAPHAITGTLLAAYTPPGQPVPDVPPAGNR